MKKIILISILLILSIAQENGQIVVVPETQEDYNIVEGVYSLTESTFPRAREQFDYMLVKFFAPWCGHCKNMANDYKQAAQAMSEINTNVKVAEVDCTQQKTLCQQQGIRGYPTLLFFTKGAQSSEKYASGRSKDAIVSWLKDKVASVQDNLNDL